MNIFQTDKDPVVAAQNMVDRHVVKMILEYFQILSTVHRFLDGTLVVVEENGKKRKRWVLPDEREEHLYKTTHINHPSTVWVRSTNNNYNWLYAHTIATLDEYTYRYGKIHASARLIPYVRNPPNNIPIGPLTPVTPAMDEKYIVSNDSVASYRKYYIEGKKHLHKWKNRNPPEWLTL